MAVPFTRQNARELASAVMARRLVEAGFDRLENAAARDAIFRELAATVATVYGFGTVSPPGGLGAWAPFVGAAEALAANLSGLCGEGVLERHFAGTRPPGAREWESVFRDATDNLFDNVEQWLKGRA